MSRIAIYTVFLFVMAIVTGIAALGCTKQATSADSPRHPYSPLSIPVQRPNRIANKIETKGKDDTQTQHYVNAMLQKVAMLRQLPARRTVKAVVIDRAEAKRQIEAQIRRDVPPQVIESERQLLRTFGFIPPDYEYEQEIFRLLSSQIAGYFDPVSDVMYLLDDMSQSEKDITLAHELVHALQNQHYMLANKVTYEPGRGDTLAAIHGLAEGDATSLMLDYAGLAIGIKATDRSLQQIRLQMVASMLLNEQIRSFPRIMRDSLVAPYLDGIGFVNALRQQGGWQMVDEAWNRAPTTTEQLLHPEKWRANEPAQFVSTPKQPSGEDWILVHSEMLGEQGLSLAFEEWMSKKAAIIASEGWGGDRTGVWKNAHGDTVGAWHVRFDVEAGADPDIHAKQAIKRLANSWHYPHNDLICHRLHDNRLIGAMRVRTSVVLVTEVLTSTAKQFSSSSSNQTQPDVRQPQQKRNPHKGHNTGTNQHYQDDNFDNRCVRLGKWAKAIALSP